MYAGSRADSRRGREVPAALRQFLPAPRFPPRHDLLAVAVDRRPQRLLFNSVL